MDPAAGAPGDPAGAAVHSGKVLSEPVGDRPSLVLDKNGTSIQRLHWHGAVTAPGSAELPLDGIYMVPGLIRNCDGTDDTPTNHTDLLTDNGKSLKTTPSTDNVNGGPALVQNGQLDFTAKRDGMVRTNDSNSFFYGWVHKRNPRTFAGVDALGRTLLVTADGRQTTPLGQATGRH